MDNAHLTMGVMPTPYNIFIMNSSESIEKLQKNLEPT